MSTTELQAVIQRASTDSIFRDALKDSFDATVRSYDLTADERSQLASAFGRRSSAGAQPMMAALATSADASTADASTADASTADASTADASTADASTADASTADASTADASTADASTADASTADASTADASSVSDL